MAPVNKIMTKNVISLQEDTSLLEASRLMENLDINHLFVCNKSGEHTGLLSSKDILTKLIGFLAIENPSIETLKSNTISDIMTRNGLIRVADNKEIGFACNLMLEHKIHSLIVEKDGQDIGILTSHDCMKYANDRIHAIEKAKYF